MNPRTNIYPTTDLGNAERFAADWRRLVIHVSGIGYKVYRQGRFIDAKCGEAVECAKRSVRATYREAENAPDDLRKTLAEHAVKSEAERRITAMLELAKSDPAIAVSTDQLDSDPWLLNAINGTIDLRTGKLRPHDPADRITKQCPVEYDPKATCPIFSGSLNRIFANNEGLITYVQKALGMSCTGDPSDQSLYVCHGEGANGKSKMLGAVQYVLGDYAGSAPDTLLVATQQREHSTEIYDLLGKRFIVASETETGAKLRVQLVKKLTGETTVKARRLYADFIEFRRTHHLFLQTNNRPRITEDSEAVWRRIKMIPFNVIIPKPERDEKIGEKFEAEASGILTWLVFGCLRWQREGLAEPETVQDATRHYREESDPLRDFVDDCCLLGPDVMVKAGQLRQAYEQHCTEQGSNPLGARSFADRLRKIGASDDRNHAGRFWRGIGLVNAELFAETGVTP